MGQKIAPVAVDDNYTSRLNRTLTVTQPIGLLSNDTDANTGTILRVNTVPVTNPSNGLLTLSTDGSFTYAPNSGFVGSDTFEYQVCDDGTPNSEVSRFDFDTPALTSATVGPDANFINPDAVQIDCGVHVPAGLTGGSVGLNAVVPNTGGVFNFTSFSIDIEYRDQEANADILTAGNFRLYHITGNEMGLQISVINSVTGLPTSYTQTLGNFLSGNVPYTIAYDEFTGNIIYDANGTMATFSVAPPNSPLDVAQATDVTIGRLMDNSGRAQPSLCLVSITDMSILCDTGEVIVNVMANIVTNRKITYRVKPD